MICKWCFTTTFSLPVWFRAAVVLQRSPLRTTIFGIKFCVWKSQISRYHSRNPRKFQKSIWEADPSESQIAVTRFNPIQTTPPCGNSYSYTSSKGALLYLIGRVHSAPEYALLASLSDDTDVKICISCCSEPRTIVPINAPPARAHAPIPLRTRNSDGGDQL
jgi:hypothetical protein